MKALPLKRTATRKKSLSAGPIEQFYKLLGLIRLTVRRQVHHPGLTMLALLGIVLSVGLITSAAFFAQGVDRAILNQEFAEFARITGRPPFSMRGYTFPSARKPMSLENAEKVAANIAGTLASEVGLPAEHIGLQVESGDMLLRPAQGSALYGDSSTTLGSAGLIYIDGVGEHMDIVAGEPLDDRNVGDVLEVWMYEELAEEMGVIVGEEFTIGVTTASTAIPLRLQGIWRGRDPEDPFWFNPPDQALSSDLLVGRRSYITFVQPLIAAKSRQATWHIILDEDRINPAHSANYLAGIERAKAVIEKYLPEMRLDAPSLKALENFVERGNTLTITLLGFNVPAFGILLYFLVMISIIIARWQRRETAILVSRGLSLSGVLNLVFLEELVLFVIGYPLGVGLGMGLAWLMGFASGFLAFTWREALPVSMQGFNFPLTVVALGVALLARLWPAAQAAHESVVTEEREHARPTRGPFWHRFYLDFLLVLPTIYAYQQLARRGSLSMLVQDNPEDILQDPLLILVPGLFVLTAALMTMRFFPWLMRLIDLIAGLTSWLTLHLALRQLGRQSQDYVSPLLLVIVSLALGVYTLSMAASLDQWLIDRLYYQVGADITFAPLPGGIDADEPTDGDWVPLPGDFQRLPGIASATRVGDYPAWINLPNQSQERGRFLAIDRLAFPQVAWFRFDFAREPLGSLMNRLAVSPDAILVSQDFLAANQLRIGDQLEVLVGLSTDTPVETTYTIAGTYQYFPTVYETERVTLIGNLDYLISFIGVTPVHQIWLHLDDQAQGKTVLQDVTSLNLRPSRERDTRALIAAEQAKLERVGIFGTLSVGFLASIVMASLGLLIYSYASLQDRLYRFAVLHAVGLQRRQIIGQVILEYTFLTCYGAAAGALIGRFASELFVPFFRISDEVNVPLPPLIPFIAQGAVNNLVLVFALSLVIIEVLLVIGSLYQQLVTMLRGHWG